MELPRRRLPESKGECEMIRTITATVESRKIVNDQVVIDWDDDKYGNPPKRTSSKRSRICRSTSLMSSIPMIPSKNTSASATSKKTRTSHDQRRVD